MKKAILLAVLIAAPALAQGYTRGYVRKDGTYVAPSFHSAPNATKLDNFSSQGNVNPYNGQAGTVNPYAQTQRNPYGSPYNQRNTGTPRLTLNPY